MHAENLEVEFFQFEYPSIDLSIGVLSYQMYLLSIVLPLDLIALPLDPIVHVCV